MVCVSGGFADFCHAGLGAYPNGGHIGDEHIGRGNLVQDRLRDVRGPCDILGIVIDLGSRCLLIVRIDGDELSGILQRVAHKIVVQLRVAITLPRPENRRRQLLPPSGRHIW